MYPVSEPSSASGERELLCAQISSQLQSFQHLHAPLPPRVVSFATTQRAPFGGAGLAVATVTDKGELAFRAPAAAYRGLPCWYSAKAWLGAAQLHPDLVAECKAGNVAVPTFLGVLEQLAERADRRTGRNIAVCHTRVAAAIGREAKTVQRARRVAERLGLLALVLTGADMTLNQRGAVLEHYRRGTDSRTWRALPNFYAAVMPASVTCNVPRRLVDPRPRRSKYVHLPVGVPSIEHVLTFSTGDTSTFGAACAQPTPSAPRSTSAPRPTNPLQEQGFPPPAVLAPDLLAFAEALRARMPGFRRVPLRRIAPGLSPYVSAGLSVDEVIAGLNTWLTATGTDWLTRWYDDQVAERARYLIGMLRRAARAGYITTAAGHPVDTTTRAEHREAAGRPAGPVMSFGPHCQTAGNPEHQAAEDVAWAKARRHRPATTTSPPSEPPRPLPSTDRPSLRELVDQYRAWQPPVGDVDDQ